jgi:DNA-directed RNA polymerase subunit delta
MSKEKLSLLNIAEIILMDSREPMDIYALFDKACERKELVEEAKKEAIAQFYADITTSAKFVYVGENTWDLKANQKADLWEKDGSFYKEYTKIELPEEYKDKPKPVKEKVVVAKPVEEVVEEVVEAAPVVEEPKIEETVATEDQTEIPEVINDQFDDELFEDFDEDKYNEYMDTYEDQYED